MILEGLTTILVIITGFYAWSTYRILKANERVVEVMNDQAEAITRPYISVTSFLEPDNPIFYLRITNTGKTPANNLKLSLDRPIYIFGQNKEENNLASYPAFNQTIASFHPGTEIVFHLAPSFTIFGEKTNENVLPKSFTVLAEYSYGNKTVKENNIIDIQAYFNSNMPHNPYVRKLKDLTEAVNKISNSLKKP